MYQGNLSANNKDATMSIRMTAQEKEKIKEKAEKEGKTGSTYVLEAAMAGLERSNSKLKNVLSRW